MKRLWLLSRMLLRLRAMHLEKISPGAGLASSEFYKDGKYSLSGEEKPSIRQGLPTTWQS